MTRTREVMEQRRKDAEERQATYRALTPEQRLEKLDRLGHVATKERAKIHALIELQKENALKEAAKKAKKAEAPKEAKKAKS